MVAMVRDGGPGEGNAMVWQTIATFGASYSIETSLCPQGEPTMAESPMEIGDP